MIKPTVSAVVASAAPSFGPAIVTVFGIDVPVMALGMSMIGLLLARSIAPASRRKLTVYQEASLTCLLIIVLFMIVTGQLGFGSGEPLGAGMGVVWGIGLGTSGLLCIEFFGTWVMDMFKRILYGIQHAPKD